MYSKCDMELSVLSRCLTFCSSPFFNVFGPRCCSSFCLIARSPHLNHSIVLRLTWWYLKKPDQDPLFLLEVDQSPSNVFILSHFLFLCFCNWCESVSVPMSWLGIARCSCCLFNQFVLFNSTVSPYVAQCRFLVWRFSFRFYQQNPNYLQVHFLTWNDKTSELIFSGGVRVCVCEGGSYSKLTMIAASFALKCHPIWVNLTISKMHRT